MAIDKTLLAEFKEKLLEEKNNLEQELKRIADPTGTPGDYKTRFEDIGNDYDENASEVENYTDNLALEDTLEKQLKAVNDALKRIEDGTYGYCENCQQEINIERLKAYPSANTCVKCS